VLQSCTITHAPPSFCTHHLNECGAVPPAPAAVNVTGVPDVRGLERFGLMLTLRATFGVGPTSVIGVVRAFPAPSVATTVTTFAPLANVMLRLQFAALFPDALPPDAADPFTVTLVMPLPPAPLSLAVPASVMVAVLTVWPDVWLVMLSVGAVVSGLDRLIVIVAERGLPAPSVATTVNVFAPVAIATLRLQFAELLPVAEPPVAAAPLTVTPVTPLPPLPLSLAVPASVMLDVATV
jgi:hypothetical protein